MIFCVFFLIIIFQDYSFESLKSPSTEYAASSSPQRNNSGSNGENSISFFFKFSPQSSQTFFPQLYSLYLNNYFIILIFLSYHFFRGDVFTRSGSFGRQRSDSTGLKQFVSLYNIYPCYYSTVFKTILEISVINYQQISTTENLTWAQNRKLKPFDRFLQWWIYWFKIIYFTIFKFPSSWFFFF